MEVGCSGVLVLAVFTLDITANPIYVSTLLAFRLSEEASTIFWFPVAVIQTNARDAVQSTATQRRGCVLIHIDRHMHDVDREGSIDFYALPILSHHSIMVSGT